MSESARRLLLGPAAQKRVERKAIRVAAKCLDSERKSMPLESQLRGRSIADWMEEFARSEMLPLPVRRGRPQKKTVVRELAIVMPWRIYGDWSSERGPRVQRLMELARKTA